MVRRHDRIEGAWVGEQTPILCRLFVPDARWKPGSITLPSAGEAMGMPVGPKEVEDARSGRGGAQDPPTASTRSNP